VKQNGAVLISYVAGDKQAEEAANFVGLLVDDAYSALTKIMKPPVLYSPGTPDLTRLKVYVIQGSGPREPIAEPLPDTSCNNGPAFIAINENRYDRSELFAFA